MTMAEAHLRRLDARRRETCPASALVVGMQCGGSDAFSGVTANPALGFACDLLVRAGATVMFSETTEVRDGIDQLTARAADAKVAADLIREMEWYDAYLAGGGSDRSANTTPGNKKGGLVEHRREGDGLDRQVGHGADLRRGAARRACDHDGAALCRHSGQRFHLRHAAARGRHEPPRVHHRPRHALRARRGAGDQGRDAQRSRAPLARFDGCRRRAHRHRRGDYRGGRLGVVPADARGGERAARRGPSNGSCTMRWRCSIRRRSREIGAGRLASVEPGSQPHTSNTLPITLRSTMSFSASAAWARGKACE